MSAYQPKLSVEAHMLLGGLTSLFWAAAVIWAVTQTSVGDLFFLVVSAIVVSIIYYSHLTAFRVYKCDGFFRISRRSAFFPFGTVCEIDVPHSEITGVKITDGPTSHFGPAVVGERIIEINHGAITHSISSRYLSASAFQKLEIDLRDRTSKVQSGK